MQVSPLPLVGAPMAKKKTKKQKSRNVYSSWICLAYQISTSFILLENQICRGVTKGRKSRALFVCFFNMLCIMSFFFFFFEKSLWPTLVMVQAGLELMVSSVSLPSAGITGIQQACLALYCLDNQILSFKFAVSGQKCSLPHQNKETLKKGFLIAQFLLVAYYLL